MSKEFPNTFTEWRKEKCGEVKLLPPDSMGNSYESNYMMKFNHLKHNGWKKEGGAWVNERLNVKIFKIDDAFIFQQYQEEVLND